MSRQTLSKNAGPCWTPRILLRTFDISHDDHDEEAVVVGVVSVVNAGSDLARADHLLQGDQHQLDRQEGHTLVEEVEGAVKDQVPVREGSNFRFHFLNSTLSIIFACKKQLLETLKSSLSRNVSLFFIPNVMRSTSRSC